MEIILSEDGSNTIKSSKYGVCYHSIFGAIEESLHVFISAGLHHKFLQGKKHLSIFEMGFGSGLNAWLSYIFTEIFNITIEYHAIENDPLANVITQNLNYQSLYKGANNLAFEDLHSCDWNKKINLNQQFSLNKINADLLSYELPSDYYDIIYFDAFAPNTQSDLWEEAIHQNLYDSLKAKGILVTYCAKGAFKRTLKKIGYNLDPLPGPNRKHEMTRAIK